MTSQTEKELLTLMQSMNAHLATIAKSLDSMAERMKRK